MRQSGPIMGLDCAHREGTPHNIRFVSIREIRLALINNKINKSDSLKQLKNNTICIQESNCLSKIATPTT